MGDTDYLAYAWELYKKEMESRDNADYEVNTVQMQKLISAYSFFAETADLISAYSFFAETADTYGGTVDPFRLVPKEVNGGVTAYFTVFHLFGDEMTRFSKIIEDASALSIDTMKDGRVCISFAIPRVFVRKA